MSGNNRGLFLASLAGISALMIAWGCGYYLAALNYPDEQRHQPYRYAADKPFEVDATAESQSNTNAFEYRIPCREPKGRDESDLCAQWRAAKAGEQSALWAKRGVWATAAGNVGLLVTIILSRLSLDRAKDANEIARESGVAQDRAWIKLSVAVTQVSVTRDHIISRAKVKTENVGNSVALDITCWASLHIGHTGDFMDKGFFDSLPPQFYGSQQSYVIWPDDSLSHDRNANGLGISTHEIIGHNYRVFLLAIAEYRTIFDKPTDPKRKTELIVELNRPDANFVVAEDIQITSEVHRLVNVRHSNIGSGEVT